MRWGDTVRVYTPHPCHVCTHFLAAIWVDFSAGGLANTSGPSTVTSPIRTRGLNEESGRRGWRAVASPALCWMLCVTAAAKRLRLRDGQCLAQTFCQCPDRVYTGSPLAPSCLAGAGDILSEDGEELGNGAERQCGGQS